MFEFTEGAHTVGHLANKDYNLQYFYSYMFKVSLAVKLWAALKIIYNKLAVHIFRMD